MSTLFKIESGMQLLARLNRKHNIENFYPILFQDGPKQSEVIELYSKTNINSLIYDIICEALLPICFGRTEFSILLLNCNSNFYFNSLVAYMRYKISGHSNIKNNDTEHSEYLLKKMLNHILIAEIYDATQLCTTIHKLENVVSENNNIGMLLVDTITAFYWTEQRHKISKMDAYIKNLLQMIQKVTKDHKLIILYTRPEHFSSSKDSIENLEPCSKLPDKEKLNYRIQIVPTNDDDNTYQVNIQTHNNFYIEKLYMDPDNIKWLSNNT